MQFSQSNSSGLLNWHRALLPVAVLTLSACSDRLQLAMQYASQADQSLQAGQLAAARGFIAKALGERDDLPELYLLKGRIELAAGSFGSAYSAYANVLSLDSTNTEALLAVAQLGLRTGNVRESLDATEKLLALQPEHSNALVARGVHSFIQKRFDEAIGYADRVLSVEPENEEAVMLKSRSLFLSGRPDAALGLINSHSISTAASEGIIRTRLELYREKRDAAGMQAQFDILRKLAPKDPELRADEADFQFKVGRGAAGRALVIDVLSQKDATEEASRRATRVLEAYAVVPANDEVAKVAATGSSAGRVELASYLIAAQQPNLAELLVQRTAGNERLSLEAEIAALRNRPSIAVAKAGQVLRSDATNCDALTALSQAALQIGKINDALRNGQRAAAECPDRPKAWLATVGAYAAREEPVSVERVFRDAIKANPQNLQLTVSFGDWLMSNQRSREALAIARALTRKSPALVAGWSYYYSLCSKSDSDCSADAERGLAQARTLYGLDLEFGKLPPNGLFGRLSRR